MPRNCPWAGATPLLRSASEMKARPPVGPSVRMIASAPEEASGPGGGRDALHREVVRLRRDQVAAAPLHGAGHRVARGLALEPGGIDHAEVAQAA
jgi:hypothetical protein